MLGRIIIGYFTAFGMACIIVILIIFVFYRKNGGVLLCLGVPEERLEAAKQLAYLRSIGVLRCRIMLPDSGMDRITMLDLEQYGIERIDWDLLARFWIGAE